MSTSISGLCHSGLPQGIAQVPLHQDHRRCPAYSHDRRRGARKQACGRHPIIVSQRTKAVHARPTPSSCREGHTTCDEFVVLVMGDDMGAVNRIAEARRLEEPGVGMVLHGINRGHGNVHRERKLLAPSDPRAIVEAAMVPAPAVGGMIAEQVAECLSLGARILLFGAPLAIDEEGSFTTPESDMPKVLGDAVALVQASEVAA